MTFKTQLKTGLMILFIVNSIIDSKAVDYFWIGGTGNWSDITHWATTSGGNTQHNSVPSAADDVFFDAP